jgi:MtaA/CmuA family methyltransferase
MNGNRKYALSSRDLVYRTLRGEPHRHIPSGPLAVHYCAKAAGISLNDYTYNASKLAQSVIRYYDKFRPDAVWISNDTWVTAEAMGAAVAFAGKDLPLGGSGQPLITGYADIDKIPPPVPEEQGRFPVMLEALHLVKEAIGKEVFVVGCFDQSPFSLACALMGIEQAMTSAATDWPFIERLLEVCADYCMAYGAAMADHGADMLSSGDSPAGLIGADLYRQVALPAEKKVFHGLKHLTDTFLSLHICGNVDHILEDMSSAGADVLELDAKTDLEKACRLVPDHIVIWGNLDPVGLLEQSEAGRVKTEIERIAAILRRHQRDRFVLSSGCALSMGTKDENLNILCQSIDYKIK